MRIFRQVFEPWEQHPRMLEAFHRARVGPGGERLQLQGMTAVEPVARAVLARTDPALAADIEVVLTTMVYGVVGRFTDGDIAITDMLPILERATYRLTLSERPPKSPRDRTGIVVRTPAGAGIADLAVLAEELGYRRAWIFDSAPLWEDPFVHLALAAERTSRIHLGTAVLIPQHVRPGDGLGNRHDQPDFRWAIPGLFRHRIHGASGGRPAAHVVGVLGGLRLGAPDSCWPVGRRSWTAGQYGCCTRRALPPRAPSQRRCG